MDPTQILPTMPANEPAPSMGGGQGPGTPPPPPATRRTSRTTAGSRPTYLKDYHLNAIMAIIDAAAAAHEEEIVRY